MNNFPRELFFMVTPLGQNEYNTMENKKKKDPLESRKIEEFVFNDGLNLKMCLT